MANLTGDILSIEKTLVDKMVDVFNSVEIINDHIKVYSEERFPGSDEEDIALSSVQDPNNPNNAHLRITSIIQIGIPRINEIAYTGDTHTQLTFLYPISFDCTIVDRWDITGPGNPWRFRSSSQFVKAVYLLARQAFKIDPVTQLSNVQLGFDNVVHEYLQQDDATTVVEEESKSGLHTIEWSLTVRVSGVTV